MCSPLSGDLIKCSQIVLTWTDSDLGAAQIRVPSSDEQSALCPTGISFHTHDSRSSPHFQAGGAPPSRALSNSALTWPQRDSWATYTERWIPRGSPSVGLEIVRSCRTCCRVDTGGTCWRHDGTLGVGSVWKDLCCVVKGYQIKLFVWWRVIYLLHCV